MSALVITLANFKGGVGKTTLAVLLAHAFSKKGNDSAPTRRVIIIDADANQGAARWHDRVVKNGRNPGFKAVALARPEETAQFVQQCAEQADVVIVDLAGVRSEAAIHAVQNSDFVVIPLKASQLDTDQAVTVVKMIKSSEISLRRRIPFGAVLTQTSPAIKTIAAKEIREAFQKHELPLFRTEIADRSIFRTIFREAMRLEDLPHNNKRDREAVSKAVKNISDFVAELAAEINGTDKEAA